MIHIFLVVLTFCSVGNKPKESGTNFFLIYQSIKGFLGFLELIFKKSIQFCAMMDRWYSNRFTVSLKNFMEGLKQNISRLLKIILSSLFSLLLIRFTSFRCACWSKRRQLFSVFLSFSQLFSAFHSFSQLFSAFLSFSQLFSDFLRFFLAFLSFAQFFSALLSFSQLFSAFLSFSQIFSDFFSFSQLFSAFLSFNQFFSAFLSFSQLFFMPFKCLITSVSLVCLFEVGMDSLTALSCINSKQCPSPFHMIDKHMPFSSYLLVYLKS